MKKTAECLYQQAMFSARLNMLIILLPEFLSNWLTDSNAITRDVFVFYNVEYEYFNWILLLTDWVIEKTRSRDKYRRMTILDNQTREYQGWLPSSWGLAPYSCLWWRRWKLSGSLVHLPPGAALQVQHFFSILKSYLFDPTPLFVIIDIKNKKFSLHFWINETLLSIEK